MGRRQLAADLSVNQTKNGSRWKWLRNKIAAQHGRLFDARQPGPKIASITRTEVRRLKARTPIAAPSPPRFAKHRSGGSDPGPGSSSDQRTIRHSGATTCCGREPEHQQALPPAPSFPCPVSAHRDLAEAAGGRSRRNNPAERNLNP